MSNPDEKAVHTSEEEEEEEDDDTPITRSSGFRMVTQAGSSPEQKNVIIQEFHDLGGQKEVSERVVTHMEHHFPTSGEQQQGDEHKKAVDEQESMKTETVNVTQQEHTTTQAESQPQQPSQEEIAKREQEARAQAEQERREAEARQAQLRAQQEALQRAQQAQKEAQLRAQQAQAQAQAQAEAQAQAQARAQQEALERAKQAQAQAQKEAQLKAQQAAAQAKAQQEAQARAQKEAQLKAEQARAQQEAQRKAQQEAQKRAQEAQAKAQEEARRKAEQARALQEAQRKAQQEAQRKAQQEAQQKARLLQQQQQAQAAQKAQPQKVPAQQKPQPQQPQPQRPQAQQPQQKLRGQPVTKPQPPVPTKPTPQVAAKPQVAPRAASGPQAQNKQQAVVGGAGGMFEGVTQIPAKSRQPVNLIPNSGEEVRAMRGGQLQEAYLSHLEKPAEQPPPDAVQPIHVLDDQCWLTQSRVTVSDIQAPQPARITIPELHGSVHVQPTVIVPKPLQTTRVAWNEFPEEEHIELGRVPKFKAQDWSPDKQGEIVGSAPVRSGYRPGRIGRVWPPPQDENEAPVQGFHPTKAAADTAWIHEGKGENETAPAWGRVHPARSQRVWPPPENEVQTIGITGSRLPTVQWPPPEFESQTQQEVEVLQTRLPIKPHHRQWPPPPPQYQTAQPVEQITTVTTQKIPMQQQQKTTTVTKRMVRA